MRDPVDEENPDKHRRAFNELKQIESKIASSSLVCYAGGSVEQEGDGKGH